MFGRAGINLLSGVGKGLNRESVWKGIQGEKLTTSIIREIAVEHPGLSLIQNPMVPGHGKWDVDHVLVYGNLAIFIDSKFYRDGIYAWVGERIEDYARNGKFSVANHHARAVELFARRLPADATCVSLVVIHSADGGQVEAFNAAEDGKPMLANAADADRVIRSLLRAQNLAPVGATRGSAARRHQRLVRMIAGDRARSEGRGIQVRPEPPGEPGPGREA